MIFASDKQSSQSAPFGLQRANSPAGRHTPSRGFYSAYRRIRQGSVTRMMKGPFVLAAAASPIPQLSKCVARLRLTALTFPGVSASGAFPKGAA